MFLYVIYVVKNSFSFLFLSYREKNHCITWTQFYDDDDDDDDNNNNNNNNLMMMIIMIIISDDNNNDNDMKCW